MKKIKNFIQFIKEDIEYFRYNNMIDYTLLDESSTEDDIINLCSKADMLGVKSVCVLPKMVKLASQELKNSNVLVCTVIDFPGGIDSLDAKINETNQVIADGADEVDMVLNYPMLNERENYDYLVEEVGTLVNICHSNENKDNRPVILKVIVESGKLTIGETEMATEICLEAGADFIKTSTGKVEVGAELDKVKIMFDIIQNSGKQMKIKASGGIRTKDQINQFLPYTDRFGMGYGSVDKLNNLSELDETSY